MWCDSLKHLFEIVLCMKWSFKAMHRYFMPQLICIDNPCLNSKMQAFVGISYKAVLDWSFSYFMCPSCFNYGRQGCEKLEFRRLFTVFLAVHYSAHRWEEEVLDSGKSISIPDIAASHTGKVHTMCLSQTWLTGFWNRTLTKAMFRFCWIAVIFLTKTKFIYR